MDEYADTPETAPSAPRGQSAKRASEANALRKSPQFKRLKSEFRAACSRKRWPDGSFGESCWLCGDTIDYAFCLVPNTPVLLPDLTWQPIGSLRSGDIVIAFDEQPPGDGQMRKFKPARVNSTLEMTADCLEVTTSDGRQTICSDGHRWLVLSGKTLRWKQAKNLNPGDLLISVGKVWSTDQSREGGYLAGIFDGEGHIGKTLRSLGFAQLPGPVLDRSLAALKELSFDYAAYPRSRDEVVNVVIRGGQWESLRLLGMVRPSRLLEKSSLIWDGAAVNKSGASKISVVGVQPLGVRTVVALDTSESTFIANGFLSHNSYPHPYSWSLDHAITVKENPNLVMDPLNFRASHLDCNVGRGTDDPKLDLGTPSETW